MFFLFLRIPIRQNPQRVLITPRGHVIPIGPPKLEARRGGKWKKTTPPIERVTFNVPAGWNRHDVDPKTCQIDGPTDAAGIPASIRVEIIDGPDDPQLHYQELLKHQEQPGFRLVEGGVITRPRDVKAAYLHYNCQPEGVEVVIREMAFTVGFRSIAYAQATCPVTLLRQCDVPIRAFFEALAPGRRLELPGSLKAGMQMNRQLPGS